MWFECHQSLARHSKTLRLARILRVERRYAVGLLVDLFSWGLDVAGTDGVLPDLKAEDIAMALEFSGKKGDAVVAALQEVHILDWDGTVWRIHDWNDYAGKLMERRAKDRLRKSAGNPAE